MLKIIFPDAASEFVFIRSYARWIEAESRRETWEEAVDRYVDFLYNERGEKVPSKVFRKIKEKLLAFEVMPSMRALWTAGPAAAWDNICTYNCAFAVVDNIDVFGEAVYILMCGTGFGYSVERKYVENLPVVPQIQTKSHSTIQISDDKRGWAESVKKLMVALYNGKDVDIDYSLIRPKGSRLKMMGGRASGPAPLQNLHQFIRNVFFNAQGRKLTPLECSDIMNQIAEIVVAGGTRRSAEICLSDLDDQEMAFAKTGQFPVKRYMANGSAVYYKKPSVVEFLREWSSLVNSGTGERGIFNIYAAQKNSPERRKTALIAGVNPCISDDTWVLTSMGALQVKDLVNIPFDAVVNGRHYPSYTGFYKTGTQRLYRIQLANGMTLEATKNHLVEVCTKKTSKKLYKQWKAVKEINTGDRICLHNHRGISWGGSGTYEEGWLLGSSVKLGVNRDKTINNSIEKTCSEFYTGFLQGWFDADGSIMGNHKKGVSVRLSSIKDNNLVVAQRMLARLGIISRIYRNRHQAGSQVLPNGKGGLSLHHKLVIAKDNIHIFADRIGFSDKAKNNKLNLLLQKYSQKLNREFFISKVESVQPGEIKDVYDCTVENVHCFDGNGMMLHNCGEILLRDCGVCNLSEVIIRADDELDDILDKVETATWIGVIQSTLTSFPYLRKKWRKNAEEERLLGVSLTGQMDNPSILTEGALRAMRTKVSKVAKLASKLLDINMPAATTCVKPSGTVSQLVNSASGIHPRYARYYIRRYRIASTDPLLRLLKDTGFRASPENGQSKKDWDKAKKGNRGACNIYEEDKEWSEDKVTTWVVSFPVKAPDKCVLREKMRAMDQLEHYKKIMKHWCEHSASCTVYVADDEWLEVGNWVYQNWEIVNGLSFLPFNGGRYEQAPYEEITREQYSELLSKLPHVDYTRLGQYEKEDGTEGARSLACSGDKCELR